MVSLPTLRLRCRHLGGALDHVKGGDTGDPKTGSADRWVELLPQTVALLRSIVPSHAKPEQWAFTTMRGEPIEPKSFSEHWYDAQRALGLRVRGLCCTKHTFVTTALQAGVKQTWLEAQTGVA